MQLREKIRRRMEILRCIRGFFESEGYLEVDTPALAPWLIPEAHIEVFATRFHRPAGGTAELFLVPSPELWMKRLLAEGSGSIYQISHCFRNHESVGAQHNPEFTMLEWYTEGADYSESVSVAERLFARLRRDLGLPAAVPWQGREVRLEPPFERLTMEEAFRRHAGLELSGCLTRERLQSAARERDIPTADGDSWDDLFHRLFLTLVEPSLPADRPVVLMDYPAQVPTLARARDSVFAERWELYVGGIELANCYTEETDPARLERFVRAEDARKRGCRVPHPPDRALAGLFGRVSPPCTGVALGVDRLAMLLAGQPTIDGVIFFPFSDILNLQVPSGEP